MDTVNTIGNVKAHNSLIKGKQGDQITDGQNIG